ncbi:MAG TPA: hypothetical protein VGM88_07460 [Kofleriaceae bacterium]
MAANDQDQRHDKHQQQPAQAPAPEAAPVAEPPGVLAVQHAGATQPPAVVDIIHKFPADRDAIMLWLQKNRGNQFVQQVMAAQGEVERELPAGVDLQSVRASVSIPGNRKLTGGYWSGGTLKTGDWATRIGIEVTHTGVRIWMSPGLYFDADWPMQDCEVSGAGLVFGNPEPTVDAQDVGGLGTGFISIKGTVSGKFTDIIKKATEGSKMVGGKYDPTQDADLQGTLTKLVAHVEEAFAGQDAGAKDAKSPVAPNEITSPSVGATVALRSQQVFSKDGSGMTIAGGAPINIDVDSGANAQQLMGANAKDIQGAANAANVQAIHVTSDGMEIQVKGKPVAKIEALTLARGGAVTIDRMTPLGDLAAAEGGESLLSLLGALVALKSNDPAAGDLYRNAQNPELVHGVSKKMIEDEFTQMVHQMVLQYKGAVPGVDLASVIGVK